MLTNQQMPLMTGLTLAQRIRELRSDLPIALVSALMEAEPAAASPFDRILANPFRIDKLLYVLDRLIASLTTT